MNRITYDTVLKDPAPLLREKSVPLHIPLKQKDLALAKRLLRYVHDSRDDEKALKYNLKPAVGIAAPQVGELVQLICVVAEDENDNEHEYLLANPKIISHSIQEAALSTGEGCLSIEDYKEGYVFRPARIKVRAYDVLAEVEVEIKLSGFVAIVMQHEIDHLSGVLFYDHINQDNPWLKKENAIILGESDTVENV
jgi:peptide deformylase